MARPIRGGKSGADGLLDVTGPIGEDGLAYRFIGYGVSEDYWRNFGRHRETLVAPSLAWYGEDTTVQLDYEHREFISPFDRGTALESGDQGAARDTGRRVGSMSPTTTCGARPT